jgi:hypothetical protein
MYPPKVQDEQIRSLVQELTIDGKPPSGAAVRAALASRYGSRGGVTRIYRLLAQQSPREVATPMSAVTSRLLEVENQNLREQLQHLRQREDAHQVHWRRVVGELWQRLRTLESLVSQAAAAGEITEALRQDVQAAEIRAGQIDVLLRAFGPGANRDSSA